MVILAALILLGLVTSQSGSRNRKELPCLQFAKATDSAESYSRVSGMTSLC